MSSNRYSALNRRPATNSSLFQDYPGNNTSRPSSANRPQYAYPTPSPRPASPYNNGKPATSPYSYSNTNNRAPNGKLTPPPYPDSHDPFGPAPGSSHFHPATPNNKGQYSASVLEELESQNDTTQTSLLSQKVSQLKTLTIAIGDEIRDSTTLAAQINDTFENSGVRLRGTMKRMLRMAERTGVGWKVWVLFFIAVWALFAYVWLF